jgi:uncharacterized repeat protein (TIGR03803 family)
MPGTQVSRSSRAMTHKKCSAGLIHSCLLFVLTLAVPASAQWKEQVLYSFQGGTNDGSVPAEGVVFDAQGNLYGATTDGGPAKCKPIGGACGTVFQLSPSAEDGGSRTETLIYQFQGKGSNDASVPSGGLIRDSAGNLYGVTGYGGTGDCVLLGVKAGCGTVYELSPPQQKGGAWTETILYSFPTAKQGYVPNGALVFDSAGNLYGATSFGGGRGTTCDEFYGGNCGAVFELSPPKTKGGKWTEKVLHAFAGGTDGANPNGGLLLDSNGTLYGTTYTGGNQSCQYFQDEIGCGTAFELRQPTKKGGAWAERQLHVFTDGRDGANPNGGLILDANGALYGTGQGGANRGQGIVFRLKGKSGGRWEDITIYDFPSNDLNGSSPLAGLILDAKGNLWGTASAGGTDGDGTVFKLRPAGKSWSSTVLHDFTGSPDGSRPSASLIFDAAGNLFGTTEQSGTGQACGNYGCGTVFEVSP